MIHSKYQCLSTFTFFGLAPSYRRVLHEQIFQLIYYGKGGFTWQDVYNFPIWLRVFYIEEINKIHKKRQQEQDKAVRKSKVSRPNIGRRRK